MAWIFLSILFIALTTTSAYKFPYPSYYQPYVVQNYRASQYRRVDDSPLLPEIIIPTGYYQERYIQSYDQEQRADSSQLSERSLERSIPFGYSQQRVQDEIRVAPKLEDGQLRNGNTSYKMHSSLKTNVPRVMNRRGVDTESAVVFPGPTSASGSNKLFNPKIKEDCGELGICENSPDYPHEYVENLLANLTDANIRFNLDVETPEIAQRGGPQAKSNLSVELCKPDVRIIYPDKVRTKSGKEVFVVNGKKKKVQGFRGTQCRAPGKPCDGLVSFPLNYKASCEQKTTDRFMWALDEKGVMELVTVPMPSCCTCVLEVVK